MCRSIKRLDNFAPPATDVEIHDAAVQFVRKISGSKKPSKVNEEVFNQTVQEIEKSLSTLLKNLKTTATPRNRELENQKHLAKYKAQK